MSHKFGSSATGLFFPTSDVHMMIEVPEINNHKENKVAGMKLLYEESRHAMNIKTHKIRDKARVPLLNFNETATIFEFDVTINELNGNESNGIVASFKRKHRMQSLSS